MDNQQRHIVCCNFRPHASKDKGQAIALYERDRETSKFSKINKESYFC
jgi:hypothetical protein